MQQEQNNTFYKIGLMVRVSRFRNRGGRRDGVEVAEVTDIEEVVGAGVFGPSRRRRRSGSSRSRRGRGSSRCVERREVDLGGGGVGGELESAPKSERRRRRRKDGRAGGGGGEGVVATELKRWR